MAQWFVRTGVVDGNYKASQGAKLGRAGKIQIPVDDSGSVWVGGAAITCISGQIEI